MNTKVLEDLGLGKNEVKVFLSLIELGPSTAVDVSKASSLHRSNVYDSLNRLVKLGLADYFMKDTTKFYEVDDPDRLNTLLRKKELELQELIPELKIKQMYAKPKSSLATFEGIVGARKVLNDILSSGTKKIFVLGVPVDYAPAIGEGWLKKWHDNRIEKGIELDHILNPDYAPHRIKLLNDFPITSIKFFPENYGTPNATYIYDAGVVLIFVRPFMTIRILSEDLSNSFKRYYELIDNVVLEQGQHGRAKNNIKKTKSKKK